VPEKGYLYLTVETNPFFEALSLETAKTMIMGLKIKETHSLGYVVWTVEQKVRTESNF
jgi:hypothetical protein